MRPAHLKGLIVAGLAGMATFPAAAAQDVNATAPVDISVTIYRDTGRDSGGFDLDELYGFALITETRRVVIPPGEHRVRFEGVADGIEPASAIVTGLPSGVIEKNRDATLLSPSALIRTANAQDNRVFLNRTDLASGKTTRTEAKVRSVAGGGAVFETADGIEALRCSGMPETFDFDASTTGLSAKPTLSVLTRTDKPVDAVVQLSYLSADFDWAADYTANMSRKDGTLGLGGWITLANGNGAGFPNANIQVVAGSLNREDSGDDPIDEGGPILARCWPQGSTSDKSSPAPPAKARPIPGDRDVVIVTANKREMVQDIAVAVTAIQEDLGDLKLYRVPDRTTLASRQSKQIRLLDRSAIPVTKLYAAGFYAHDPVDFEPMDVVLRTRNDKKNNLGLPLPSGRVSVFETVGDGATAQQLLAGEADMRDLAVNEETEISIEGGADVQARQIHEETSIPGDRRPALPFLKGVNPRARYTQGETSRIELTNARAYAINVEVTIKLDDGAELVRADRPVEKKNGQPIFKLTVPANYMLTIRYQTSEPL